MTIQDRTPTADRPTTTATTTTRNAQETTMPATPDTLARAGATAIEAYFASRNATPVTAGDGRYTIYIPGGEGTEDLQLSLASTPASRGILARVKTRRGIPAADWPKALTFANQWNRSSPLPQAVLASRDSGGQAVGALFLEGFLPPSEQVDADQLRRFIETVVAGARQFWSSDKVRDLTRAVPPAPAPATASAGGAGA